MTKRQRWFYAIVMLAPALILYTTFMAYPLAGSVARSFYEGDPGQELRFVGLKNFQTLFTEDPHKGRLSNAFQNNIEFFLIHLVVQNTLALFLAVLLVSGIKGGSIYRTIILIPTTLSVVVVGFAWSMILSPLWGVFDDILREIGLGHVIVPWTGDPDTALPTVSLISVWQWIGLPMILFIAGLLSIPDALLEAAKVDGANDWKVFWKVRFPLLMPVFAQVTILTFVGNFNAFDIVYAMQGTLAPPDFATDIMGTYFYRTTFGSGGGAFLLPDPTMGATIATVMFIIILTGVSTWYLFSRRYAVEY